MDEEHPSRSFQPQPLDKLHGGFPHDTLKDPTEMEPGETGYIREFGQRERP